MIGSVPRRHGVIRHENIDQYCLRNRDPGTKMEESIPVQSSSNNDVYMPSPFDAAFDQILGGHSDRRKREKRPCATKIIQTKACEGRKKHKISQRLDQYRCESDAKRGQARKAMRKVPAELIFPLVFESVSPFDESFPSGMLSRGRDHSKEKQKSSESLSARCQVTFEAVSPFDERFLGTCENTCSRPSENKRKHKTPPTIRAELLSPRTPIPVEPFPALTPIARKSDRRGDFNINMKQLDISGVVTTQNKYSKPVPDFLLR